MLFIEGTNTIVFIPVCNSLEEAVKQLEDLPGYGVLMKPYEVSEIIGKPETTLTSDRFEGRGLPFVKVGRLVRYRKQDVLDYINANTFNSTAEAKVA